VRKTLLITLVLVFSAVWLQAQAMGQSGDMSPNSIQGCLSYGGGHYWLTDSNGEKYQLQSQANQLQKHVGHTVELTGTDTVRTVNTTQQGNASTAHQQHVFKVKTLKHIAETCSMGSGMAK
jgi:hypothetical protein